MHLIRLMGALDHELGESTAGMAWVGFVIPGASVGKIEPLGRSGGWGPVIWKFLYSCIRLLAWDDLNAHSAGAVTWSIYR